MPSQMYGWGSRLQTPAAKSAQFANKQGRYMDASQAILVGRFRPGQYHSRARRHRFVVAYEALRLLCGLRSKVVSPAESDRLIPEFGLYEERACSAPG